jgi:hypothetical protein
MWLKGTAGGNVPYLRTARVQTAVTWPAARVAVALGVPSAGALVAVGTSLVPVTDVGVKSEGVSRPCAGVVVCVSVAGTTGDGDSTGKVAVSDAEGDGSVGRAVRLAATAVLNRESEVAAESIVGPVGGVGVKSP